VDPSAKRGYLLVYGSETGQAKAIAQDIADKSAAHGLSADLRCAETVDKEFRLVDEQLLVLVCSTTGEGEPPNNAAKMLRRLRNKSLKPDHLAHLKYTILGLGDTNYTNFCQCPKDFHQRLQALGAQTFYAPGWADDGIGLDVVCDPWIEGLWPALKKETATIAATATETSGDAKEGEKTGGGTADDPSTLNASISTTTATSSASSASASASTRPSTASLKHSIAPLCNASLSVPTESPPFLDIEWHKSDAADGETRGAANGDMTEHGPALIHNGVPFPSATSDIFEVPVEKCWRLTTDDAVKTALDVCISTSGTPLEHFRPGDAFAIVVENPAREVDALLQRLFPAGNEETQTEGAAIVGGADVPFSLSLLKNTTKVKAEVPPFIPSNVTPRHLFESLVDVRSVPKKGFLRTLAQFCGDEGEKRRLLELSSKQGAKDYDAFVRQPSLGIIDILLAFPSANPPIQRLIENLPRLQARSYSISSSPLRCPGRAHFVFNVVEFEMTHETPLGKSRRGICTGMLDEVTKQQQSTEPPCFDGSDGPELGCLSLSDSSPLRLSVFTRPNPWFLHPDHDLTRPLIMVGPGTGVAPFLGFLQHREKLMEQQGLSPADVGESWLFYGCRHQNRDFLYKAELERLHSSDVLTHLEASFSRDASEDNADADAKPKYVQHRILQKAEEVRKLLTHPNAMLYVCGDAKNMARNVNDALIDVLVGGGEMTKMAAMKHLADLREQKRYLQDVWA